MSNFKLLSENMIEQNLNKTILLGAGIIAVSIIFSAMLIKMDSVNFNITTQAVGIKPSATTTAPTTVATTVATTTAETTTTEKSLKADCDPCFDYFEFIDCVDGVLRIKNGGSPITVSEVRGGIHQMEDKNPSYMPNAIITIKGIEKTGNQEIEIEYWMNNEQHLDVATIIN